MIQFDDLKLFEWNDIEDMLLNYKCDNYTRPCSPIEQLLLQPDTVCLQENKVIDEKLHEDKMRKFSRRRETEKIRIEKYGWKKIARDEVSKKNLFWYVHTNGQTLRSLKHVMKHIKQQI